MPLDQLDTIFGASDVRPHSDRLRTVFAGCASFPIFHIEILLAAQQLAVQGIRRRGPSASRLRRFGQLRERSRTEAAQCLTFDFTTNSLSCMAHHVEYATLACNDWFNNRRLLESIGRVPSAELRQARYERMKSPSIDVWFMHGTLGKTRVSSA